MEQERGMLGVKALGLTPEACSRSCEILEEFEDHGAVCADVP
jgi:hypothetical protein